MYKSKNAKKGQAKLLAALAVFAMVACVFAAIPMGADETDAYTPVYDDAVPSTAGTIPEGGAIVANGVYKTDVDGAITLGAGPATLYLLEGKKVTIAGATSGSIDIYTMKDGKYDSDSKITIVLESGTMVLKAEAGKYTYESATAMTTTIVANTIFTVDTTNSAKKTGEIYTLIQANGAIIDIGVTTTTYSSSTPLATFTGNAVTIPLGATVDTNTYSVKAGDNKITMTGLVARAADTIQFGAIAGQGSEVVYLGYIQGTNAATGGNIVVEEGRLFGTSALVLDATNGYLVQASPASMYIAASFADSQKTLDLEGLTGDVTMLPNTTVKSSSGITIKDSTIGAGLSLLVLPNGFSVGENGVKLTIEDVASSSTEVKIDAIGGWNGVMQFDGTNITTVAPVLNSDGNTVLGALNASDAAIHIQGDGATTVVFEGEVNAKDLKVANNKKIFFEEDATFTGTAINKAEVNIADGVEISVAGDVSQGGSWNVYGKLSVGEDTDTLIKAPGASETNEINGKFYENGVNTPITTPTDAVTGITALADLKLYLTLPVTSVALGGDIIVDQDIVIDEDTTVVMGGYDFKVQNGSRITNNGAITYGADAVIGIGDSDGATGGDAGNGTFVNAGTIMQATSGTGFIAISLYKGTESAINAFVNEGTIDDAYLSTQEFSKFSNEGYLNLGADDNTNYSTIIGDFENAEGAVIGIGTDVIPTTGAAGFDLTIGDGTVETEFANYGDMILGADMLIDVMDKAILINGGSIEAKKDGFTPTSGQSITGNGTYHNEKDGTIGIQVGTKYITGSSYTVNMDQDVIQNTTYMSIQNVTVPEGKVLTVKKSSTLYIQGTLTIEGELIVEGTLFIGSLNKDAKAAGLTVNNKLTIAAGGELVVGSYTSDSVWSPAKAVVSEGATLTVAGTAKMDVAQKSELDVKGTLDLQTASILTGSGLMVDTTGTANMNGYIGGATLVKNKGIVVIDNGDNIVRNVADISKTLTISLVADKASVTVNSYLYEGKLIVNDENIMTYEAKKAEDNLYVSGHNEEIVFEFGFKDTIGDWTSESEDAIIVKKVLQGSFTITASASSKAITDAAEGVDTSAFKNRVSTYSLDIAGTIGADIKYMTVAPEAPLAKFDVTMSGADVDCDCTYTNTNNEKIPVYNGTLTVVSDLIIDEQVAVITDGIVNVSGKIDATAAETFTNNGILTVTGLVSVEGAPIVNEGKINAVMYIVETGTGKDKVVIYNYTTLDQAVEGVLVSGNLADKVVTIMGDAIVAASIDIPSEVDVVFSSKDDTLTVGTVDDRNVVMTMEKGAALDTKASGQITVLGTLTFEDKNDDETQKTISDVVMEGEADDGFRTYTNIYTAVEEAAKVDGEVTVTVSREVGYVELTENLTIPENVTLVVGESSDVAGLLLMDGVTLTIDGVVASEQNILAETRFADKAMNIDSTTDVKRSSAIVVNGILKMTNVGDIVYGDGSGLMDADKVGTNKYAKLSVSAPIFGAYYNMDDVRVVSNLAYAVENVEDITTDITINGPVKAGDVVFNATEDCDMIIVNVAPSTMKSYDTGKDIITSLTVNDLALVGGILDVKGAFYGIVSVGEASIDAKNVKDMKVTDKDGVLIVSGNIAKANAAEKTASIAIATGSVLAKQDFVCNAIELDVNAGATLVSEGAVINTLDIMGTVTVASGKSLTANTVKVAENGVLDIAVKTDTVASGIVDIDVLYVGILFSDIKETGAAATVNGPINADIAEAYVLNGAIVSDEAQAVLDEMKSSTFFVNEEAWFTAYAADDKELTVDKLPAGVENVVLLGWITEGQDEDEAWQTVEVGEDYYAVLDTYIYTIYVIENPGVSNVYIDGLQMNYGMIGAMGVYFYGYYLDIEAGEHTISYDLSNGWSGDASITVNDVPVLGGLNFTTEGDPAVYTIQISGLEKSGYVDPVDPSDDKDSGMGLTDYLLIVLVVLVVILAILVAVRMMRS